MTARKIWGESSFLQIREGHLKLFGATQGSHITTTPSGPHQWPECLQGQNKDGILFELQSKTAFLCCKGVTLIGFFQYNLVHPVAVGKGSRAHVCSPMGSKAQCLTSNSPTASELPPWTPGWMSAGSAGAEAGCTELVTSPGIFQDHTSAPSPT